MPAQPLSTDQIQQAVETLKECGGNASRASRQLGMNRMTFLHRIQEGERRGSKEHPEKTLREGVFRLATTKLNPPKWAAPKKRPSTVDVVPILFGSDYQWGETIRPEDLDGINGFDVETARTRLRRLFERTLEICFGAMSSTYRYQGIVYLRGGDMISGDIHQELRETNYMSSIPAVIDLVAHEVAGIDMLLEKFPRVHIISVPGNHGRTTFKPQAKRSTESNYDTLSAYMIEAHYRAKGDKRVTFSTPESGDAMFSIYGWQFLATHGDRIGSRGGEGFVGPAATIARGMKKTADYYGSLGKKLDYILIGHFHTSLKLEQGFSNGCLPGYSEYARSFRMRPNRPSQWLFLVNQHHGIIAPWEIYLEDAAVVADAEALPWAR